MHAIKTTILLTTHDISDLEILCKRIIIIDKGSIIFDGDIQKVNSLFGSYRVLKLKISGQFDLKELSNKIGSNFNCRKPPEIESTEDGWINITINLDEIKLVDMLNYLLTIFPLTDIKVEEVPTEKIIREIYEGGLK